MATKGVLPKNEELLSCEMKGLVARYTARKLESMSRRYFPYHVQELVVENEGSTYHCCGSAYQCSDAESDAMFGEDPHFKWVDELAGFAGRKPVSCSQGSTLPRLRMIWIAMSNDPS